MVHGFLWMSGAVDSVRSVFYVIDQDVRRMWADTFSTGELGETRG